MLSLVKTVFKSVILFLFFCAVVPWNVSAREEPGVNHGVVNAWKLNLRKEKSNDSPVVQVLEKGRKLKILATHGGVGGWLEVVCAGSRGYVRNRPRYVTLVDGQGAVPAHETSAGRRGNSRSVTGSGDDGGNGAVEKKARIRKKIARQRKRNISFSKKETEIIEGLNEIDRLLDTMRGKIAASSRALDQVNSDMAAIAQERKELVAKIDQNREYVKARLNALYRIRMVGRLEVLAMPDSFYDFLLQENALKRVLVSDFDLLDRQIRNKERLEALPGLLEKQRKEQAALKETLNAQMATLKAESQKRRRILAEIRQEKKLGQAALASLETAAVRLEKEIRSLSSKPGAPGKKSFSSHRNIKFNMPVNGRIIATFGPSQNSDYSSFTFQSGIDIKVDRGEPVRSIFRGRILYSQWLKGYGNLIIIDHGENYYTLYAHVQEAFKEKGDLVGTGEVIATAGDTGSMQGVCLHFEIRHHGKPVNPLKWLKKGV
ncbi:MAG TPA: peptidoglycan DD-metalloendopeptidase family protein [Desulfobacteraceae bacterium]|nr:peptidoglycan DD-metalloendopeptidase family protein [Desulfobacteraceae bacterium]